MQGPQEIMPTPHPLHFLLQKPVTHGGGQGGRGAGEGCKQDAPLAMEKEAGRSHVPHSPPLFPNLGVGEAPFLPCAPSGETRKGDC